MAVFLSLTVVNQHITSFYRSEHEVYISVNLNSNYFYSLTSVKCSISILFHEQTKCLPQSEADSESECFIKWVRNMISDGVEGHKKKISGKFSDYSSLNLCRASDEDLNNLKNLPEISLFWS